jgi:lipopolysaccharide export LptBFGC system permease protein LptF
MSLLSIRVIAAIVIVVALAVQARRAAGRLRRRAFATGAVAFGLFGVGNLLGLLGADGWLIYLPTIAGLVALAASLATLISAYRAGEFAPQIERAREIVGDERRKQDEAARARETRK